jgi:hypothetical protein
MSNLKSWKYTEETQLVLKRVNAEINSKERELLDRGGLLLSPDIVKEYVYAKGRLDGINFVKQLIEEGKDE